MADQQENDVSESTKPTKAAETPESAPSNQQQHSDNPDGERSGKHRRAKPNFRDRHRNNGGGSRHNHYRQNHQQRGHQRSIEDEAPIAQAMTVTAEDLAE